MSMDTDNGQQTDQQPEWVSASEYGRIYGVDRGTVYKWLHASLLVTYRMGSLRRIRNVQPDVHETLKKGATYEDRI